MKGNIHKKLTREDKFDRYFACWVKNNRKKWHFYKRRNNRIYRRIINRESVSIYKNIKNYPAWVQQYKR